MGTAEHYHPHLSITIDGSPVPVPPNIGVDPNTGAMSAVHTHEGDGTIHIEADTVGEKFTLGQLFTQWGVALTPTQIGGVRAKAGEKVTVTSNGTPVPGDPADLRARTRPADRAERSLTRRGRTTLSVADSQPGQALVRSHSSTQTFCRR